MSVGGSGTCPQWRGSEHLSASLLGYFTSRSAGAYQPECWGLPAGVCWGLPAGMLGFTSLSAGVLPA